MYYKLLEKLSSVDRCHVGPEMTIAYENLVNFYQESRLIMHYSKWIKPYTDYVNFKEIAIE